MATTTVTARPSGRDRLGQPLPPRTYVIDRDPEPFGEGRSRIFAENRTFRRPDGQHLFTPVVVLTESIRDVGR